MTKKTDSILGLPPVAVVSSSSSPTGLVPYEPTQALTRDQQRVTSEWQKQMLVIDSQSAQTLFAQEKIAELFEHAALTYVESMASIHAIKETAKGKEYQPYVDEFTRHMSTLLAQKLVGTVQVSSNNIGQELARTLYLLPEQERRNLLQRLFGAQ